MLSGALGRTLSLVSLPSHSPSLHCRMEYELEHVERDRDLKIEIDRETGDFSTNDADTPPRTPTSSVRFGGYLQEGTNVAESELEPSSAKVHPAVRSSRRSFQLPD